MSYTVGTKVKVMDQNSNYRNMKGKVTLQVDAKHTVRLEGHACRGAVLFDEKSLKPDLTTDILDYIFC